MDKLPATVTGRASVLLAAVLAAAGCDGGGSSAQDAGLSWDQGGADIPEYSLGRLVVGDESSDLLTVYDLDTDTVAGTLALGRGARVYSGGSGRYAYVFSPDRELLYAVDPGQWLLSHLDHFHVARSELGERYAELSVGDLSMLTANDGWIAAFDAAAGTVFSFQERSITANMFDPARVSAGGAHAGAALVSHATLIFSALHGDEAQPVLAQRSVLGESELETIGACVEAGDLAAGDVFVLAGCRDGITVLSWNAERERFEPALIEASAPEAGERVARVRAHPDLSFAIADLGAQTLARVEPGRGLVARADFEEEVVAFDVRRQGIAVLALTATGVLHELDPVDLSTRRSLPLLEPVASEAPALVLSHAYAYIADPRSPELFAVRLRSLELEKRLAVGGAPAQLALVGMPRSYTDERE